MGLIITICGKAGSGKSALSRMLAKKLGFKHYSIGDLRREMAGEKRMTLAEFNKLGEREDFTDRDADEYQKKLGQRETNFVIDGRTSFHFIPHSVKILVTADLHVRALRVFKDERKAEKFSSLEEAKKSIEERDKSDVGRYKKYYGIDPNNLKNYDIIIDTSKTKPEEALEKVLKFLRIKNYISR